MEKQRMIEGMGDRLKKVMSDRGLTQTELGKRIGVTPTCIHQIVTGKRYGTVIVIALIAQELNVSTDYLILGKE